MTTGFHSQAFSFDQSAKRQAAPFHPVKRERLRRAKTQKELADFVGVGVRTIERVERGEPVGIVTIARLCNYFEKTPQELGFTWE